MTMAVVGSHAAISSVTAEPVVVRNSSYCSRFCYDLACGLLQQLPPPDPYALGWVVNG